MLRTLLFLISITCYASCATIQNTDNQQLAKYNVKIIYSRGIQNLEKDVNTWLENNNVKVLEINHCIGGNVGREYTCLILYTR